MKNELWYTEGPVTMERAAEVFKVGANGVRLTFSFSTADYQLGRARHLKETARGMGLLCTIVADLAGEKFRLGSFEGAPSVPVKAGAALHLVHAQTGSPAGNHGTLPMPNLKFFAYLTPGSIITVGDGSASFKVESAGTSEAIVVAVGDGVVNQNRGVFVQGSAFQPRSLTEKDVADLRHVAAHAEYDIVALSFVASDEDVRDAKKILAAAGRDMPVMAKIETLAGVENLEAIARAADMLMAARGDLALGMPWVELPGAVEAIAATAEKHSRPWILATQVAEGLERFTMPTRAEICDLAHWLGRGAAGAMLSYETAFGARPVEAVRAVSTIIKRWGSV